MDLNQWFNQNVLKTIAFLFTFVLFFFVFTVSAVFIYPHAEALRDCHLKVNKEYAAAVEQAQTHQINDETLCLQEKNIIGGFDYCTNQIREKEYNTKFIYDFTLWLSDNVFKPKKDIIELMQTYNNYCVVQESTQ